ncbi:MAG: hypothetical protein U0744_09820 [Gemmataceae bacterium]
MGEKIGFAASSKGPAEIPGPLLCRDLDQRKPQERMVLAVSAEQWEGLKKLLRR